MSKTQLVVTGLLNLLAIFFAFGQLMINFVPPKFSGDVGNIDSINHAMATETIKAANAMRNYATITFLILVIALISNYIVVCRLAKKKI